MGRLAADTLALGCNLPGGTRPRSIFRDIDYQQVTKRSVETQPKKVYVSTPHLKRYLIINQLHFTPVAASRHLSRHLSRHVERQDTIL